MAKLDITKKLKELNVSQSELAKRLGITPPAMYRTLHAEGITFAQVQRIATALGCSISELVEDDNNEPKQNYMCCPYCGKPLELKPLS